ncbi:MAG: hypothetical protein ACJ76N_31905 [Thermoanaerobaculia bacterium]
METKARRGSIDFIPMAVLAILVLSMIVTWFLAGHYSLPDDDTIALGLLGSVIVLFAVLVLLASLVGSGGACGSHRESYGFLEDAARGDTHRRPCVTA